MTSTRVAIAVVMTGFLGVGVMARQQPATAKPAAPRPAAAATAPRPVATVKDIMDIMLDPGSKVVFGAVSTEVGPTGTVSKAPTSDAEWRTVKNNALMMIEGANLLLIAGRHVADAADAKSAEAGSLTPVQIEALVTKDRATWNKLAAAFRDTATQALTAVNAKKPQDVDAAGSTIDEACENCHTKFWYPNETIK